MKISLHPPILLSKSGKRNYNEDFVFPDAEMLYAITNPHVFLVCDGVGGADKGEIASRIVCTEMFDALSSKATIGDGDIHNAIALAQGKIDQYLSQNEMEQGMATTMTMLGLVDDGAILAHIGDSRIYHFRNHEILYKTTDHSLVNEMVIQELISVEEAKTHPQRNVITKAISGSGQTLVPDIHRIVNIEAGDYFFLCTDGVIESFTDEELNHLLADSDRSNDEKVVAIDALCNVNSRDNYSLYLIQIQSIDQNS